MTGVPSSKILFFATQGTGHGDEQRIETLLDQVDAEVVPFDRRRKVRSMLRLLGTLLRRRPKLVVMEGTGVAGGIALMSARVLAGVPYAVSSGDAVAPYVAIDHRWLAPIAGLYERLLYRLSSGFIGWTPYLVGRALTYGAPRAMTAPGWSAPARPEDRDMRRRELGIADGSVVFGLVGSLDWGSASSYCYGKELIDALLRCERPDLCVLIIGDGSGFERLRKMAGEEVGRRVILPGRIPKDEVSSYLAAIDVASLPQSVDGVGSFRYSTKISEYLESRLPVVTGQIPLAYDLDAGWIWRLPGDAPWDARYVEALSRLMESVSTAEIDQRRGAIPDTHEHFDRKRQQRQVAEFVAELLAASA